MASDDHHGDYKGRFDWNAYFGTSTIRIEVKYRFDVVCNHIRNFFNKIYMIPEKLQGLHYKRYYRRFVR